tara:strand:+ start:348 stop:590 length:243 start_codon:yes stop_codon:yes gene_type:complete
MEEFEIEWTPEETEIPCEEEQREVVVDINSSHIIDKICKIKYGHTNWARLSAVVPEELNGNPYDVDLEHGVVFFKNALMV